MGAPTAKHNMKHNLEGIFKSLYTWSAPIQTKPFVNSISYANVRISSFCSPCTDIKLVKLSQPAIQARQQLSPCLNYWHAGTRVQAKLCLSKLLAAVATKGVVVCWRQTPGALGVKSTCSKRVASVRLANTILQFQDNIGTFQAQDMCEVDHWKGGRKLAQAVFDASREC